MLPIANNIREVGGIDPAALPASLLESAEPLVVRGLAARWPVVGAARESAASAVNYLRQFYRDATVVAITTPAENNGRFFYNEDLSGFNFKAMKGRLDVVLAELERLSQDANPPALYVGSTTIDTVLPGFRAQNDFDFGDRKPAANIWIGNRTRVAAHHDLPDNLACVVAGHRRFTLFPAAEVGNLYVGPLEFTPAGQPISLVDFANPDYTRFPRFAQAVQRAQVAELGPGDAIFIPSMWWHHIESLDAFNVLVNYWWRQVPAYMDSPIGAMMLTLMTVRDLPPVQRAVWEQLFRHYVFEANEKTAEHIPEKARRALGPLDANIMREMRANVLARLNR
jgi:hypothetical protein